MPSKIPPLINTKIVYLFALFVFLLILSLTLINIKTSETLSQSPSPAAKVSQAPKARKETKNPKIQAIISSTQMLDGQWAIYIKDLKTQNTYELNADQIFDAASIYKLAVMYMAFDQIEKGALSKNQILTSSQGELDQAIAPEEGTEIASDSQTIISYSVEEALRLMITISDNYSALLLAENLGWQNIEDLMTQNGLGEINLTEPNSPNVTARAIGALLEKIYKKEAVAKIYSQEMINLLLAQTVNDRIPKYLPADVKVAHKTGELETIRNDAGIVFGKKGTYIFVFLSDTDNPLDASETIATLSKEIFDRLEK